MCCFKPAIDVAISKHRAAAAKCPRKTLDISHLWNLEFESDVLFLFEVWIFLRLRRLMLITNAFSLWFFFSLCPNFLPLYFPLPSLMLQNQCASALGSTVLRCDKLDRDEIKNLLMCFLHILKSMSEGRTACLGHCAAFWHTLIGTAVL